MTNEPEWRDANPETADLPNKGKTVIVYLATGLLLGVVSFIGIKIRTVGLGIGGFAFFFGIGMLIRLYRKKANLKIAAMVTAAGFLMLLTYTPIGLVRGFAVFFLMTGAIALIILGLFKAIKLAWDLGQKSP